MPYPSIVTLAALDKEGEGGYEVQLRPLLPPPSSPSPPFLQTRFTCYGILHGLLDDIHRGPHSERMWETWGILQCHCKIYCTYKRIQTAEG